MVVVVVVLALQSSTYKRAESTRAKLLGAVSKSNGGRDDDIEGV